MVVHIFGYSGNKMQSPWSNERIGRTIMAEMCHYCLCFWHNFHLFSKMLEKWNISAAYVRLWNLYLCTRYVLRGMYLGL